MTEEQKAKLRDAWTPERRARYTATMKAANQQRQKDNQEIDQMFRELALHR